MYSVCVCVCVCVVVFFLCSIELERVPGEASAASNHKGYTAIPGEVNNEEQCRVTSQLARKGRGGNDHDRLRGLQYAIDHCSALRLLVDEVCLYLGGC